MNLEKVKDSGLFDDVTEVLEGLYVNEWGKFVVMPRGGKPFMPKDGARYIPMTRRDLREHVEQLYAIAVFAPKYGSKFISFDVDDGKHETVRSVIDALGQLGIDRGYVHVSLSGRKGYHLEVFFDEPVRADALHALYEMVILVGQLDKRRVEFRPTHTQAIKLPLSQHYETGRMCWFVDRETLQPLCSYEPVFEIKPWPAMEVYSIVWPYLRQMADKSQAESPDAGGMGFHPGSVVLTAKGTRHRAMVRLAVYQRHMGVSAAAANAALLDWYRQQDKRLIDSNDAEVQEDAAAIVKWVYDPKFQCSASNAVASAVLSRGDLLCVLNQPTEYRRKTLFALLVFDRAGCNRVSIERLAKMTDTAKNTVRRSLRALEFERFIAVQASRIRKTPEGKLYTQPNGYVVNSECLNNARNPDRGHDAYHRVGVRSLEEDFQRTYYGALDSVFALSELVAVLSLDEIREYAAWHDEQKARISGNEGSQGSHTGHESA